MTYLLNAIILCIKSSRMVKILTENPSTKIRICYQKLRFGSDSYTVYMRGVWKGVLSNQNSCFNIILNTLI